MLIIISFLVFLDEGVDGLNELAANLSVNESGAGGAVGAVGPGGTGKPGCENGAGCASRTGLEDSISSMSMNETKVAMEADRTRVAERAIAVGGPGKPGVAGGSGGIGNPESTNGAGCVSNTGVDGLQDLIDYLNMNKTDLAIGADGTRVAEWAIRVGGLGKPRGANGSGGIENPGCTNGAGYVSRTGVEGLEDFIDNLSIHETKQTIGAGGISFTEWGKESIRAGGTEGAIGALYSGPLFPAYSSKVPLKRSG